MTSTDGRNQPGNSRVLQSVTSHVHFLKFRPSGLPILIFDPCLINVVMRGSVCKSWGRSQFQSNDVVNAVRGSQLQPSAVVEADTDGSDGLGEVGQGVGRRLIGWQLIDQVHAGLVFDRPRDVW